MTIAYTISASVSSLDKRTRGSLTLVAEPLVGSAKSVTQVSRKFEASAGFERVDGNGNELNKALHLRYSAPCASTALPCASPASSTPTSR